MNTPNWLIHIRRHSTVRQFGKWIERNFKRLAHQILMFCFKASAPVDPLKLENVQRILLLRPNFRIGNALISTPLVAAVRARFPAARLDYLGADTTAILLQNLPIDQVFMMSRSFILRPWAYAKLLWHLHQQNYDLIIQVGIGSFSETICMRILGARYRMGAGKWAEGVCNIQVDSTHLIHEYDGPVVLAKTLGVPCLNRPVYATSQPERDLALSRLFKIGFFDGQKVLPFVALFVGGHKDKRWPAECWDDLVQNLQKNCSRARILVFLGPEELALGARMRTLPAFQNIPFFDPLPLRDFAALMQQANLIVTPDTGPMHLAVALNVPTVAILQKKLSLKYAPRGEQDVSLLQPTIAQVCKSIQTHKKWSEICHP